MMYAQWAKTEAEAARLQSEGWRPSRMHEVACSHNEFAMLLIFDGEEKLVDACPAYRAEPSLFRQAAEAGE